MSRLLNKKLLFWILFSSLAHSFLLFVVFFWPTGEHEPVVLPVELVVLENPSSQSRFAGSSGKRGAGQHRPKMKLGHLGSDLSYESSRVSGYQSAEDLGTEAFVESLDRKFSEYRRLHEKVNSFLSYPAWLKQKIEGGKVTVSIVFRDPSDKSFRVHIRSDSQLLQVHIARMFRQLMKNDLPPLLASLDDAPIYLYFTFGKNKAPEIEISRFVHNNRLFFERGNFTKRKVVELKTLPFGGRNSEPQNYLSLSLGAPVSGSARGGHIEEEEYIADPAFRQSEVVLYGRIPS